MRESLGRRRLLAGAGVSLAVSVAGCRSLEELSVSGAAVDRTEARVGEPLTVTATVTNDGVVEATSGLELTADGTTVDSTEVTVNRDAETTVTFEYAFDTTGEHSLGVSGRKAGTVSIKRALEVVDASVTVGTVGVGQSATVVATVRNRATVDRTGSVAVTVDGTQVTTASGSVPAESTGTVQLEPGFQTPGTRTVSVEGVTAGKVTVTDGWREFGYDTTNSASPAGLSGPGTGSETLWTQEFLDGIAGSPVAVGETVYCGTGNPYAADNQGSIVAVSATDGVQQWQTEVDGRVDGTPTLVDGLVVVGANTGSFASEEFIGDLVAVEQAGGRQTWTRSLDSAVTGSPTADADTVYVATYGGTVSAIAARDGTVRWERQFDGPLSGPAVADGTVYVGDWDGRLRALSAADGSDRWHHTVSGRLKSAPAVGTDGVYIASVQQDGRSAGIESGHLASVTFDGAERWSRQFDSGLFSTPAVGADGVFAGVGLSVWGFDTDDGAVRWRGPDATAGSGTSGTPAVVDGTVYGGFGRVGGGFVAAFTPEDGTEQWRTAGDGSSSSPAVLDDRLFVATGHGTLRALGTE